MSFPRYPKYKESGVEWLGEVPAAWTICAVRRILRGIEQGWSPDCLGRPAAPEEWGVLKAGCVNRGVYAEAENKALPDSLSPMPEYEVRAGDVLVSRASGSPDLVGSTALVITTRPKLMLSDKVFRLRLDARTISPTFFVAALNSRVMRAQIERAISGADGLANNLPQSALRSFLIPIPPASEQLAIAAFLDRETARIDALVAEQERLIELLREKRQAAISHAVTKGLDPDVPMKPSGLDWLGEIPAHWGVARLDHLFNQARFPVSVEPDAAYQELGVRSHGRGVFHKEPLRGVDLDEKEVYWVQPGALMFNIVFAWEGAVAVTGAGEAGLVASHRFPMFMPEPERAAPEFYKYFLTTNPGIRLLDWHSPGAAGRNRTLNRTHLVKELVPAPPVPEQRAICDALASEFARADTLITEANRAITLLQERRSALITAAVTGQIDVRGAA